MAGEWYFQVMGQELGPLTAAELKSKVDNGQIQRDTLIRKGPDGKWTFGGDIKGLFAPLPAPAPKPVATPAASTKAASPSDGALKSTSASGSKSGLPIRSASKPPSSSSFPVSIPMSDTPDEDGKDESGSPLMEFYDFVGFREAITPALYDAIKQYATESGITIGQVNRRALAEFIKRPELASNLLVKSIEGLPQRVNEKHNQNSNLPLAGREKDEYATFRVSLYNCGHSRIDLTEGFFLPKSVEARSYDVVAGGQVAAIDHRGHIPVRLRPLISGKPIRMALDETILPQSTKELVFWFYDDDKPSLTNITGQLQLGSGSELAISDFFTMILHGDSPSYPL